MTALAEEALGTILEAVVFLHHFSDLKDPRQLIKVIYPLDEILLLSLTAVLAGAENFTAIAQFCKDNLDFLQRFRLFANGTPDHDASAKFSRRWIQSSFRSVSSILRRP